MKMKAAEAIRRYLNEKQGNPIVANTSPTTFAQLADKVHSWCINERIRLRGGGRVRECDVRNEHERQCRVQAEQEIKNSFLGGGSRTSTTKPTIKVTNLPPGITFIHSPQVEIVENTDATPAEDSVVVEPANQPEDEDEDGEPQDPEMSPNEEPSTTKKKRHVYLTGDNGRQYSRDDVIAAWWWNLPQEERNGFDSLGMSLDNWGVLIQLWAFRSGFSECPDLNTGSISKTFKRLGLRIPRRRASKSFTPLYYQKLDEEMKMQPTKPPSLNTPTTTAPVRRETPFIEQLKATEALLEMYNWDVAQLNKAITLIAEMRKK